MDHSRIIMTSIKNFRAAHYILCILLFSAVILTASNSMASTLLKNTIEEFSSYGDRTVGSPNINNAADYIEKCFRSYKGSTVGKQRFLMPTIKSYPAKLLIHDSRQTIELNPAILNAITPPATPQKGLTGPLIYAGKGTLADFNGLPVKNSIVLMDMESEKNWLNAASLGASALIYIDKGPSVRGFFKEKVELSPINFPRYYITESRAQKLLGISIDGKSKELAKSTTLTCDSRWERTTAENIYCLIPGKDPNFSKHLVIVESFYDSSSFISGNSPGADESVSISSLLELGKSLSENPPKRSILLVATSGHAQALNGMREFIKAVSGDNDIIKRLKNDTENQLKDTEQLLAALKNKNPLNKTNSNTNIKTAELVHESFENMIKDKVNELSKSLMEMRMENSGVHPEIISLAQKRAVLRKASWKMDYSNLPDDEHEAVISLLPAILERISKSKKDLTLRLDILNSTRKLRKLVNNYKLEASFSLHLSSHGSGVGGFDRGWLYDLRPRVNLTRTFSHINDILTDSADHIQSELGISNFYTDSLRPSHTKPWQSWFIDKPQLGGEVATMAGLPGVTFATINDGRQYWGTPFDTVDNINWHYLEKQIKLITGLIRTVASSEGELSEKAPKNGFSLVHGKGRFIRQGELFADQPAPGAVFMAFQGNTRFYAMTDEVGNFEYSGVASKNLVQHKLIIEGYKFDKDGKIVWAIDKQKTGKNAYRLKMNRSEMETKMIMFACSQTTLFDLLTPRTFRYMTKIQVLDGNRDSEPLHYWYSRIDTRSSTIASIFLEPQIPLKVTLSDTVLNRKMILINSSPVAPSGFGYNLSEWPVIPSTDYRAAYDMWTLLEPRISNLETHGIVNNLIRSHEQRGLKKLSEAQEAWKNRQYDDFMEKSRDSWAMASKVYLDVESTQKDVLVGVLFYIALFIPFSYCMERLIFSFADIHKRIIAFLGILAVVIGVIYKVHPAFQLTYSPMVVILAFFILGLSVLVSLIIFFRFEKEMILLQQRAYKTSTPEISKWKAFMAAFVIGVSNLRRRKLRTFLTCLTLTILTFTIMSFTAVKSLRQQTYLKFSDNTPYYGVFMKNIGWNDLPPETLNIVANDFTGKGTVAPRGWVELEDKTTPAVTPVEFKGKIEKIKGLIGLSWIETQVSEINKIIESGTWLKKGLKKQILLSSSMAKRLSADTGDTVTVWGEPFLLCGTFNGKKLYEHNDLDGEPITPVIFPSSTAQELTEVEAEAIESGDDIDTFHGRYTHIPGEVSAIIPYETLVAMGGNLKSLAIAPINKNFSKNIIDSLVDRYGLPIFSCDATGTYLCQSSDTMNYSGVPNILIPLIISALIVLNTMITSVYERKKEIGVYTSIGMAPMHVSFLFIAEAIAFAVISVVAGYLVAQTASEVLAGTSLWYGMTANYSSMAGVAAMLLVIAITLISVIYPSKVAADIAIPDINRSWKMPETEKNSIETILPFLLKYDEQRDIGGFMLEYLEAHTEVSHGLFSTSEIEVNFSKHMLPEKLKQIKPDSPDHLTCFQFDVRVWLSPFDFGVKQMVRLEFRPSKQYPEFLEAALIIGRESGEIGAWKRLNKNFINAIRKQFLVWRSLNSEDQKSFRDKIPEMMAFGFTGLNIKKTLDDL